MISINLKPGTRRMKAGGSLAGSLAQLKTLPGMVKDPWPLAAVAAWVVAVGFLAWAGIGSSVRESRLEPELDQARAENRRYRQFLAQKRKAEAVKDSIVMQIATIRQVDGDRYVWAHILDEVTRALPPYTWLTNFQPLTPAPSADSTPPRPTAGFQLVGRTMDIGGFTRFLRQLEDSPFLDQVTALSTETVVDRGRAVTAFTIKASFSRPGREHLRTSGLTTGREG